MQIAKLDEEVQTLHQDRQQLSKDVFYHKVRASMTLSELFGDESKIAYNPVYHEQWPPHSLFRNKDKAFLDAFYLTEINYAVE